MTKKLVLFIVIQIDFFLKKKEKKKLRVAIKLNITSSFILLIKKIVGFYHCKSKFD